MSACVILYKPNPSLVFDTYDDLENWQYEDLSKRYFYIKEDETTQQLRIIAYDEAGNECAKEVDDIMISTTPKTRWNHRMRNALMILAGVSGVISLALLIRHRLFCRSR